MSSVPTTNTTSTSPANNQTVQNQKEEPVKDNQKPKETTCVRSFFRSYLLYFFLATGTAFTSYLVYRRFNKN
jgi:hypothetical protein